MQINLKIFFIIFKTLNFINHFSSILYLVITNILIKYYKNVFGNFG